jgi:DNA-binding HxlR family transcriptional regulator
MDSINQKALTETLRRLARNGLVERSVTVTSPIGVEYSSTPLGLTLRQPSLALYDWALDYRQDLADAQTRFDDRGERRGGNSRCRPTGVYLTGKSSIDNIFA